MTTPRITSYSSWISLGTALNQNQYQEFSLCSDAGDSLASPTACQWHCCPQEQHTKCLATLRGVRNFPQLICRVATCCSHLFRFTSIRHSTEHNIISWEPRSRSPISRSRDPKLRILVASIHGCRYMLLGTGPVFLTFRLFQ